MNPFPLILSAPSGGGKTTIARHLLERRNDVGYSVSCTTRAPRGQEKDGVDYSLSADLTGQANHLGVTIQADIIKQKLPENNGGFKAMSSGESSYGKLDDRMYTELASDHPIDL